MIRKKVIYGHSVPYRNMCRYNSGFFFRHPLLEQYDYYWRVEPSIKLFCDITYDPFLLMQDEKKVYGFTLSLFEYIETIPTLWDAVKGTSLPAKLMQNSSNFTLSMWRKTTPWAFCLKTAARRTTCVIVSLC